MKQALITGITGQDGSYLAELLLKKGYQVHGIVRRVASRRQDGDRLGRISHIKDKLHLHNGDLLDYSSILNVIDDVRPDECYHLAAQSFVPLSFEDPIYTMSANVDGTLHVLSAIKKRSPESKFYFAATSEMFGEPLETPQNETTRFNPRSPYAISKTTGFFLTKNYREAYSMFACSGIFFNHESPRRGEEFVTQKIARGVARIKLQLDNVLVLGNMDTKRDWGYAGEYVETMWKVLQQDKPDDYVVGTGEARSIREFVDEAFNDVGITYQLADLHEMSIEDADAELDRIQGGDQPYVVQHPKFYRPAEVNLLLADSSKAKRELNWEAKVKFPELVRMMVENAVEEEGKVGTLATSTISIP